MRIEFEQLGGLLRLRSNAPEVIELTGPGRPIVRAAYQGFCELKEKGISLIFKEAPWVIPPPVIDDPKSLYVAAVHLHRMGHEGYSEYTGKLPKNMRFGDDRLQLIQKMGEPAVEGGGGFSTVLKKSIPKWARYQFNDVYMQFQFDGSGFVDMITLFTPDLPERTGKGDIANN